eukprot:5626754-Amphidinium_carterae.1
MSHELTNGLTSIWWIEDVDACGGHRPYVAVKTVSLTCRILDSDLKIRIAKAQLWEVGVSESPAAMIGGDETRM